MKHYAKHLFAVLATIMLMAPAASKGQVWTADPVHSTVMYTIKHMVTPMIGMFKKFNVDITWNAAKPLEGDITATLDASSVVMGMDKLEGHLRSADFFDVDTHPEWSFKSTSITADKKGKSKTKFIANGKLTVKGVTKDIAIPFELLGMIEDPRGNTAGFSAEFTINRLDYGVGQDGGGMIGNDIKINVLLEMHPKK